MSNLSLESLESLPLNDGYNSDSYIEVQPSPTSPTKENAFPLPPPPAEVEKYSIYEIFKLSAIFSIVWFLSNYFQNASLSLTNVSSSTILVLY